MESNKALLDPTWLPDREKPEMERCDASAAKGTILKRIQR